MSGRMNECFSLPFVPSITQIPSRLPSSILSGWVGVPFDDSSLITRGGILSFRPYRGMWKAELLCELSATRMNRSEGVLMSRPEGLVTTMDEGPSILHTAFPPSIRASCNVTSSLNDSRTEDMSSVLIETSRGSWRSWLNIESTMFTSVGWLQETITSAHANAIIFFMPDIFTNP